MAKKLKEEAEAAGVESQNPDDELVPGPPDPEDLDDMDPGMDVEEDDFVEDANQNAAADLAINCQYCIEALKRQIEGSKDDVVPATKQMLEQSVAMVQAKDLAETHTEERLACLEQAAQDERERLDAVTAILQQMTAPQQQQQQQQPAPPPPQRVSQTARPVVPTDAILPGRGRILMSQAAAERFKQR